MMQLLQIEFSAMPTCSVNC